MHSPVLEDRRGAGSGQAWLGSKMPGPRGSEANREMARHCLLSSEAAYASMALRSDTPSAMIDLVGRAAPWCILGCVRGFKHALVERRDDVDVVRLTVKRSMHGRGWRLITELICAHRGMNVHLFLQSAARLVPPPVRCATRWSCILVG